MNKDNIKVFFKIDGKDVRDSKTHICLMSIYDIKNNDIGVRLVGVFKEFHDCDDAFLYKRREYIRSLQLLGVSDNDITNNFVFKKLLL